ncbi:hypothetical protein LWI28_001337 [Acer negundo]|uniref:Late embryogenesis abundant protein LEA-2 subgroup domain-containing protein n=1 Tax=Acer negundo TaxID=4023 RepID=A0AAD5NX39_ACENE|nr:hypothetical protein LWI28_012032 [Acer negundo]KAI9188611.1 hypothetical protein LWI28_014968 [Acer negundo]KAI9188615.1 hypothetical protein LWI28_001337 [Acer negundo]KAK4857936.1 hypothetical protein QYF36_008463 [Acer negundo]
MAKQTIIADQQTQQCSPAKFILAIFLTPIFVIGLILFLVWLGLHPHFPSFQIQNFSVPGLDQLNGFRNVNITFNITVRNPNRSTWIHYESIDGSVYYKDHKVGVMPILYSFNQSPKNTTILQQVFGWTVTMSSANNHRWMEIMNDRKEGTVKFSVTLASLIRFKKSIWDRRHHRMHAECIVEVGPDGLILPSSVHDRCPVNLS